MRVNENISAPFIKRLIAYILDLFVILFIIITPFKYNLKNINFSFANLKSIIPQSNLLLATSIILAILIILYWAIFEYLFNQSIGKIIMNIQVISPNKKLTFPQTLVRNLSKFSILLLVIDSIPIILRTSNKRYLEKASNTEVIAK